MLLVIQLFLAYLILALSKLQKVHVAALHSINTSCANFGLQSLTNDHCKELNQTFSCQARLDVQVCEQRLRQDSASRRGRAPVVERLQDNVRPERHALAPTERDHGARQEARLDRPDASDGRLRRDLWKSESVAG